MLNLTLQRPEHKSALGQKCVMEDQLTKQKALQGHGTKDERVVDQNCFKSSK